MLLRGIENPENHHLGGSIGKKSILGYVFAQTAQFRGVKKLTRCRVCVGGVGGHPDFQQEPSLGKSTYHNGPRSSGPSSSDSEPESLSSSSAMSAMSALSSEPDGGGELSNLMGEDIGSGSWSKSLYWNLTFF